MEFSSGTHVETLITCRQSGSHGLRRCQSVFSVIGRLWRSLGALRKRKKKFQKKKKERKKETRVVYKTKKETWNKKNDEIIMWLAVLKGRFNHLYVHLPIILKGKISRLMRVCRSEPSSRGRSCVTGSKAQSPVHVWLSASATVLLKPVIRLGHIVICKTRITKDMEQKKKRKKEIQTFYICIYWCQLDFIYIQWGGKWFISFKKVGTRDEGRGREKKKKKKRNGLSGRWEKKFEEKKKSALNYSPLRWLISIEAPGQSGSFSMRVFPFHLNRGWRRSIKSLSVCK